MYMYTAMYVQHSESCMTVKYDVLKLVITSFELSKLYIVELIQGRWKEY